MVQQWEAIEIDIDGAHLEGAPRRIMGAGQRQRSGPSLGGIARQAIGMGRRVLIWEHRTQSGTLEYNCGNFRVR